MTAKMRLWYGGLDRRAYGGTPQTDRWSIACARPVRRGQSATHDPGGLQGASGRGCVGKARPQSASGLGQCGVGADAKVARRARASHLGRGHLHTGLKFTIGRLVLVLVSPLLRHSLLSPPFEAKLILMAISPTIATMEPHKVSLRLRIGLLTWFLSTRLLNQFLLTSLLALFPKEHFP
jgi:hypothetical protein